MSSLESDRLRSEEDAAEHRQAWYPPPARPHQHGGPRWGLLVTGLIVAGLGVMAWNYLGPDLRRYLKIERM
jgi:hypothetical protein